MGEQQVCTGMGVLLAPGGRTNDQGGIAFELKVSPFSPEQVLLLV